MGLRINTNIQALNAHKNLTKTDGMLSKSLERLSSGLRINRAADDASGLTIADNLKAQHTGIGQAITNANDGINIIQIADGALEESINIVNTIRTKAIQASSDAQNATSRAAIQSDVDKLLEELDAIGGSTAFNGVNLLDGSFTDKKFHIGAYKNETADISIGDARGTKVGAMAYAKTKRVTEGAVSSPMLHGMAVNADKLSGGDIKINGIEIGSSLVQVAGVGTKSTAWSKAAAINAKVNETGVQAKATTELIVSVGAALSAASLNGVMEFSKAATGAQLVSLINNNQSFQEQGIRAEALKGQAVKIVANDGRNLSLKASLDIYVNGYQIKSGKTYTQRGNLTLSNARAMTTTNDYIKAGTLNSGDLTINGVDVAAGGSLTLIQSDDDKTLLNAINNNEDLQKLGIRAERISFDGGTEHRIRLISDTQEISIGGNDPSIASFTKGTTKGIETTGIIIEGNAVDTDTTKDNYLDKIGFGGSVYGTTESTGVINTANNDKMVVSRAYLQGSSVNADKLSGGDVVINGVTIGSSLVQLAGTGGKSTAWAKATAINAKVNETGVQAKATTELIVSVGAALSGASLNGVLELSKAGTGAQLVSLINNNQSLQEIGIKAEALKGQAVRITAEDGRNLSLKASGDLYVNGMELESKTLFKVSGTLTLSNARAMVTTDDYIKAGTINSGDLTINGVDIAGGGSITLKQSDDDKALMHAINNNEELQKMGIRAERISFDGGTEHRIRLISTSDAITIGGADPSVAGFTSGTTSGIVKTGIDISGNAVDTDVTKDNYLDKLGLAGTNISGATEDTGANNSGANDKLMFGNDRLSYNAGDISINGNKLLEPTDDGLSDVLGDKSAAAWAGAVNALKDTTGVEADIIKANKTGAGMITAGTLQQGDIKINGVDIVRDNTGGSGMTVLDADSDSSLINAINEYKDQTGVVASRNSDGNLVLTARDGRNIHVETTANGNKIGKFAADFGKSGVAQDSVYFGDIRLVSDKAFTVDGAGSSGASKEISLMKLGLAGGNAATEATSDMKGDGTIISGLNYDTAIAKVDVTTQEGAELAIRTADYALKRLDEIRSGLGSTQNQLTSTVANLSVTQINVRSSESSIRDVDFAAESTTFSKMQVLMQAGTYAQSQANATSQNVMRLLQ